MAEYRAQRDAFGMTGSPALPDGLNFGSQLWWMERLAPEAMANLLRITRDNEVLTQAVFVAATAVTLISVLGWVIG